jgi:hypothetical protein
MATPDLIDSLVADLKPIGAGAVLRRLGAGFLPGLAVSVVLMLSILGMRPNLAEAAGTWAFWIKVAYAVVLAGLGGFAMLRLGRPGGEARGAAIIALIAFVVLAILAAAEFTLADSGERMPLVIGTTALKCPWLIVLLSAPIFIGTFWALAGLAPTRLATAGAGAGLFAGASGTAVYALHCIENGLPFVTIWYSLGILICGIAGAILGRWILRW